jgi:hypothetical protein
MTGCLRPELAQQSQPERIQWGDRKATRHPSQPHPFGDVDLTEKLRLNRSHDLWVH